MPSDIALSLQHVHYAYKSNWTTRTFSALHDVSLEVREGEVFGFLGHNGAGKTTTIKCVLDLIRPKSGSIKIFGTPSTDPAARAQVGYLSEQPYFYDHLSVLELLEMYAKLAGVQSSEVRSAVERALELVHMKERAKSKMRALSKGLTQRVGMAQAIVAQPKLLILDEPFSGLDPIGRKEFKDLLFYLKDEGTTIFVSSHILGDIERLSDRVSIMAKGRVRTVLSVEELAEHAGADYELIVKGEGELLTALKERAQRTELQQENTLLWFDEESEALAALREASQSLKILSYRRHAGSLEDLFIELVQREESEG